MHGDTTPSVPANGVARRRRERFGLVFGLLLIALGLATNEWAINAWWNPDAPISRPSTRVLSWAFSLNALLLGLWLFLRRRRLRLAAVFTVALAYAIGLIPLVAFDLWEGYRILRPPGQNSVETSAPLHVNDPHLGWKPRTGQIRAVCPGLYDVTYTIEPGGFRRTVPQGADGPRVFFFGDSFTFGQGVRDEETFASRVAQAFAGHARVINAGVCGYGITQMYVRFLELRECMRPGDIVVFTPIADDLYRDWRYTDRASFVLFWNQPLVHHPVYSEGKLSYPRVNTPGSRLDAVLWQAPRLRHIYRRIDPVNLSVILSDAAEMVARVRASVEDSGAHFLLVFLPTRAELLNGEWVANLGGYHFADIRSAFPHGPEALGPLFYAGNGDHYTASGHAVVGDAIAGLLRRSRWLQPGAPPAIETGPDQVRPPLVGASRPS